MGEKFYYDTKIGIIDTDVAGDADITETSSASGKKDLRVVVRSTGLTGVFDGTVVVKGSVDGVAYLTTLATINLTAANQEQETAKLDMAGFSQLQFIYTKNSITGGSVIVSYHATR